MSTLEDVRTLRGTSLRLLPGFWQARALMDMTIELLEYFAREAEHELTTGNVRARPLDPEMASRIRIFQALFSAYLQLHQPEIHQPEG